MSITAKLRETIGGTELKILGEDSVAGWSRVMAFEVPLGVSVPFVRALCSVEDGGGICSHRAWVGCMAFGMNMRFVWVS